MSVNEILSIALKVSVSDKIQRRNIIIIMTNKIISIIFLSPFF